MKLVKRGLASILIIVFLFSNVAFGEDFVKDEEFFNAIKGYIMKNYAGEIKEEDLYDGAIKGMFEKLDLHSTYMDKQDSGEFTQEVKGKLYGIGALIGIKDGNIIIQEPLEDSPAKKGGILPGDVIIAVDGNNTEKITDVNKIIDKIKGDKGTTVTLTINRNGKTFDVKLIRDEIKINPVKYRVIQGNIGYLKISEFNENVTDGVEKAISELKKSGVKKIVLDLRGNPGGGLRDVVDVAEYFVKGNVVTIKDAKGNSTNYISPGAPVFDNVAVLIDDGSASASEILAGAIQDNKVGVLIGEKSYGKGTVQTVLNLKNGEMIKLTIAKYYLPSGRTIDHTGLIPDIEVSRFDSSVNIDELQELNVDKKTYKSDAGLHILGIQERLNVLGYKIDDPKGIFGDSTYNAVKKFQSDNNMYSYGTADLSTLSKLNEKFSEYILSDKMDNQLNKAIEILNK